MTFTDSMFPSGLLRFSRRAVVMLVLATYMFAGALHGMCNHDLTSPSRNSGNESVISMVEKALGHTDNGIAAEHHCHGCFSVSISEPLTAVRVIDVSVRTAAFHDVERRSLPRGIDPRPPKLLI